MAKVLGLKQLLQKKYEFLDPLPDKIRYSFGNLVGNFIMIVWGKSANGKSNLLMEILKALMPHGKVLYIALEEGFEATTQLTALRQLNENDHAGKIEFADHEMTVEELKKKLKKKKSPKFIVIDSVQYWDIDYAAYKELKKMFQAKKSFIFISHADGKEPSGNTAKRIRYDAGIKTFVEGFVAFVASRYGGNNPFVIWEQGAKKYWVKQYSKIIKGIEPEKLKINKKVKKQKPPRNEETPLHETQLLEKSQELVLGEQQATQPEGERVLPELVDGSAERWSGTPAQT